MNSFGLIDNDKASLRILTLLFVRGGRTPKMILRGIIKHHDISGHQFDKTMKNLQELGLVEEKITRIKGKRGITKYPQLTPLGLEIAKHISSINELLNKHTLPQPIITEPST